MRAVLFATKNGLKKNLKLIIFSYALNLNKFWEKHSSSCSKTKQKVGEVRIIIIYVD
jgi:hypothetical protein